MRSPPIRDLAIIGDRHTAAVVTRLAEIVWYCPKRFDMPAVLNALLDPAKGSAWRIDLPGLAPVGQRYLNHGAVLETRLRHPGGSVTVTDWMPLAPGEGRPGMICRRFAPAEADLPLCLDPRPDYGSRAPSLRPLGERAVEIDGAHVLHGSHPVRIEGASIRMTVPRDGVGWAVLADGRIGEAGAALAPTPADIERWLADTLERWEGLARRTPYRGPFAPHAQDSLRALRLLAYGDTGATVAAVTTSLPEVVGGKRNYDYRYAWLRDSALVMRALVRFGLDCEESRHYLGFIAGGHGHGYHDPLDPVMTVLNGKVPSQSELGLPGYRGSRPEYAGNKAARQIQLGSYGNFLIAAAQVYRHCNTREHWRTVAAVADCLVRDWPEPDSGIWEETPHQFTASKVFAACGLEAVAAFAEDLAQAHRWRAAARDIRDHVARHCMTPSGAFAAVAGERAVDISAALFPVWSYCAPDDPAMVATIRQLEEEYSPDGILFHRHLVKSRAERREGAFLVGTFWVAHYWIARGDLDRARRLLEGGLRHATALGLFPEEVDARTGELLGNLPLGLAHGSFLSAVDALREKLEQGVPLAAD